MLKDKQKAELYHQLSQLSSAGFPIIQAADAAMDTQPGEEQRQFLQDLKSGVEGGETLSGAAEGAGAKLSSLEISILRAAEEGGKVPEGFEHLGRYFGMLDRSARKVRMGMIYPAILLHLAIILPAIPSAIASKDIPGTITRTLMLLGLLYIVLLGGRLLFRAMARKATTEPGADRLLRKIPFVGKVRHHFALSRFAEVLRIQLLCGRGPKKAMQSAAQASASASLQAATESAVIPEITAGRRAGPPLIADGGKNFPPAFARGYATGEESGGLDDEMGRWSNAFADQAETSVQRLTAAVPKIVYGLVALLVIYQVFKMAGMYFGPIEELMKQTL